MSTPANLVRDSGKKSILRVEGPDDKGVLIAALNFLGSQRVEVLDIGGIDGLLQAIPVELKRSNLGQLGIVADADNDAQACWRRIKQVLTLNGYTGLPSTPRAGGAIINTGELPTVGVWIMPNNSDPGAVEQFVRGLVPGGDLLWTKSETVIDEVSLIDRRFGSYQLKATLHTWLAWQAEPGRPMGQAITKRFLDPGAAGANGLYLWLRELYGL